MGKRQWFSVKNFERYQHYKHRNPPWVKLHYDLLDDDEFISLDIESRHHYMTLLIIAGRKNNVIPYDLKFLKKVMRLDEEPDLSRLFESGFLLASRKHFAPKLRQNALSETETETETDNSETDTGNASKNGFLKKHISKPEEVSEQTWYDFLKIRDAKKSPFTKTALNLMLPQAKKAGKSLEEVLQICCQRGWQGFNAEWVKREDDVYDPT